MARRVGGEEGRKEKIGDKQKGSERGEGWGGGLAGCEGEGGGRWLRRNLREERREKMFGEGAVS